MSQENLAALPRSVRKQADKANQLMEQLVKGTGAPDAGNPAPAGEPAAAAPPQQPAPAPASSGGTPGEPVPAVPAQPKPEDTADYWKHRFSVLQGKYNAEIPLLQQQLNELKDRIPAAPAPQPAPAPVVTQGQVTTEEIEEYGDEFFDVVGRHALAVVLPVLDRKLSELQGSFASDVKVVKQEAQQTATDRFLATLTGLVPNWYDLNQEPGWLTWLDGEDLFTGVIRQRLLDDAHGKLDAKRVAAMFTAYVATKGPGQGQPVIPPAPGAGPQSPRLQDFSDPGSVRVGQQGVPPGSGGSGQIWTSSAISKFYDDKRRGVYAGREAEMRQIDEDIQRAGREGRYRQG